MEENKFFMDTMRSLLEAIAIDKGAIKMEKIEGLPADTLRIAKDVQKKEKPVIV